MSRYLPLILLVIGGCFALPAAAQQEDPFSVFAPYSTQSRYNIDHKPWTQFLDRAVYEVGRSDRKPARRDGSRYRVAGTSLSTSSNSRYRYEGNRVMFHMFSDETEEYIGLYRQALQDTMNRVEYRDFSRDEQLAFWLNLYNAVVIHEITKAHPVSRPNRLRIRSQKARLFDAKLVEVHGVELSLNDIRYNIVYRYWRQSNVIYGFWNGDIGSPNIQSAAYEGSTVDAQLQLNAREFVNSMRGVDRLYGKLRISELYVKAKPHYFKNWPEDLYSHFSRYADWKTAEILSERSPNPRTSRYATNTADAEGGETIRPNSNDNPAAVTSGSDLGSRWSTLSSNAMRGGLSHDAVVLARRSEERRARRRGSVVILDVYTEDPETTEALSVEPDDVADESETQSD